MNETNLTSRQKAILNLVNQSNGISREQIQKQISPPYDISKPTLARDLIELRRKKLLRVEGEGKKTCYWPYSRNSAIRPFDLDSYFLKEPDERIGVRNKFDFNIFENMTSLFSSLEIERVEKSKKSFTSQTEHMSEDIFKREIERYIIELAWKSSKIEGNTYSLLETETLIKNSQEAKGKTRQEAIMILNHKKTFEMILKHRGDFKRISISLINQIHDLMVADLDIRPGIRKQAVGITGTVYQPLDNEHQIVEAMEKLVFCLNSNSSVLEKALIANSLVSYIQPYTDGNKRTGRMLTNGILLAYDYYPLSYRSINEEEFKKALIIFYEQGSLYQLKKLFLEQLVFALETYFK
jgi:Fic family protein